MASLDRIKRELRQLHTARFSLPRTIIWVEGEPIPDHEPGAHIITGVDKNGHLL